MARANGGGASRATKKLGTRAVLRYIDPGDTTRCQYCDQPLRFKARVRLKKVICSVYKRGKWNRVEHFHERCYDAAGQPHGVVDTSLPRIGQRGARKP